MGVEVLHFTITGEYMTNFSRELFAEGRYSFAISEFLCDSLPGLTQQQAVDIITCKKKLIGENNLELVDDDATPEIFGIELSLDGAWNKLCKRYVDLNSDISTLQRRIGLLGRQQSPQMALYKSGSGDFSLATDIKNYKRLMEKLKETLNDLSFIGGLCGKTFKDLPLTFDIRPAGFDERGYDYNPIPIDSLMSLGEKAPPVQQIDPEEAEDLVHEYLSSQEEIDKKMSETIKPNPVQDINDASWIAPNGDHYGLDGMIANMLHIQMADKLKEDGVITITNPDMQADTFLRREGWITIHNGWVLYDGYYHGKELTPEQVHALYLFGQHYGLKKKSVPIFGTRRIPITGVKIQMMDKPALKKLFDL